MFAKNTHDISNPILDAVGHGKTFRIIASAPNMGAVQGFPDDAALEYTIDIKGKSLIPADNQYVPSPFQGLIASLSESQTDPHAAPKTKPKRSTHNNRNQALSKLEKLMRQNPAK